MNSSNAILKNIIRNKYIYILLLPGILFYVIFAYFPMYGITLAFKEFQINKGIIGSPWIGFANFKEIFRLDDFWNAFYNTIGISFQRLLIEFSIPIILALMLNEIANSKLKRFFQTVFTFPNFLSWIVVSGIIFSLFSDEGAVNQVLMSIGADKQSLMMDQNFFRPLLYISSIWKSAGWSSIIYLAAISSINPEIYEAATIDGATRIQQMLHITWPGIKSTVAVLFVLAVGNVMNAGFDQIFNMYNASVYNVADIIDTYIYRRTFQIGSDFGSSTAVGLFKSLINLILLIAANLGVKKLGEEGII